MADERYDIAATVPPGATREQLNLMLRNLLAQRFELTLHHQQKEFPEWELTIAKGGPKLKPTAYPEATPVRPET
jgi:uncharacterized protein (TIGR03435 family)